MSRALPETQPKFRLRRSAMLTGEAVPSRPVDSARMSGDEGWYCWGVLPFCAARTEVWQEIARIPSVAATFP